MAAPKPGRKPPTPARFGSNSSTLDGLFDFASQGIAGFFDYKMAETQAQANARSRAAEQDRADYLDSLGRSNYGARSASQASMNGPLGLGVLLLAGFGIFALIQE